MENNQFEIYIDYDKNANNPERVFLALANILLELSNFDKIICESLALEVESKIVLEKIESGSVRAFFTNILELIDDESLKKLDLRGILGNILVEGKYRLIDALKEKPDSQNVDIQQLQEDLFQLSKPLTNDTLKCNNYIPSVKLVKSLNGLNTAFGHLTTGDKIQYITRNKTIDAKYNSTFNLAYEKTQLIEQNMITNQKVILTIKKPDLLGDSQWEFKYNGITIKAKVEDEDWLTKFQNGDISIQAKDSIECDFKIETNDIPSSKTEIIYTVLKVHKILHNIAPKQLRIKDN